MKRIVKLLAPWLVLSAALSAHAQVTSSPDIAATQSIGAESDAQDAVAATGTGELAADSGPLNYADLAAWLDGYVDSALQQSAIAGAVVSVVKDGQLLYSAGYGYADVDSEQAMDPASTLVRVGSTSKLFTWTAAMQLAEAGKLKLDQDVSAFLDFPLPEGEGSISMLDLMNHRAGFEEGLREVLITDTDKLISNETYLKQHPRQRIFPSGEVVAYSNYGTALAGYVVERVAEQPFDDYIDQHILQPLGMDNSSFRQPLPEQLLNEMSGGYMTAKQDPWHFEYVTTGPAGSLSATANDMAKFMLMHLQQGEYQGAQILQPQTARQMHSPSTTAPDGFARLAHGFFHTQVNGHTVMGHGGDTVVFHTDMNLLPDEGVGFFVSFNSRGEGDAVYGVRQRLFDDFMDRYFPNALPVEDLPAVTNDTEHAQAAAGYYRSSRRVETGFLKLLYLLQQVQLIANEDGTLSMSTDPDKRFREVAPNVWREEGGSHSLYVSPVDGVMTVVDSRNPVSVLHRSPSVLSAGFNQLVLLGAIAVLLLTVLAWPLSWCYRRRYGVQLANVTGRSLLPVRLAAIVGLAYLFGWFMAFLPLLQNQLDAYGTGLDGLLRSLQIAALLVIVAAVIGVWHLSAVWRDSASSWSARLFAMLIAAALLGVVWLGYAGKLMGFGLEY